MSLGENQASGTNQLMLFGMTLVVIHRSKKIIEEERWGEEP